MARIVKNKVGRPRVRSDEELIELLNHLKEKKERLMKRRRKKEKALSREMGATVRLPATDREKKVNRKIVNYRKTLIRRQEQAESKRKHKH